MSRVSFKIYITHDCKCVLQFKFTQIPNVFFLIFHPSLTMRFIFLRIQISINLSFVELINRTLHAAIKCTVDKATHQHVGLHYTPMRSALLFSCTSLNIHHTAHKCFRSVLQILTISVRPRVPVLAQQAGFHTSDEFI
jgi:hypothetical protein